MQTISVVNGLEPVTGGWPVAVLEKHDAHPGGELIIDDGAVHEVALTAEVRAALNDGRLREATESRADDAVQESDFVPVPETVVEADENDPDHAAKLAAAAEAGDDGDGDDLDPGDDDGDEVTVEVRDDDTVESLCLRYTKAQLTEYAEAHGVEIKSSMREADVAEAVLDI